MYICLIYYISLYFKRISIEVQRIDSNRLVWPWRCNNFSMRSKELVICAKISAELFKAFQKLFMSLTRCSAKTLCSSFANLSVQTPRGVPGLGRKRSRNSNLPEASTSSKTFKDF